MMKKKPTARLTLLQEATESSKLGKTKTTKNRKTKNINEGIAIVSHQVNALIIVHLVGTWILHQLKIEKPNSVTFLPTH
jgi:hypothetical protein